MKDLRTIFIFSNVIIFLKIRCVNLEAAQISPLLPYGVKKTTILPHIMKNISNFAKHFCTVIQDPKNYRIVKYLKKTNDSTFLIQMKFRNSHFSHIFFFFAWVIDSLLRWVSLGDSAGRFGCANLGAARLPVAILAMGIKRKSVCVCERERERERERRKELARRFEFGARVAWVPDWLGLVATERAETEQTRSRCVTQHAREENSYIFSRLRPASVIESGRKSTRWRKEEIGECVFVCVCVCVLQARTKLL